MKQATPYTSRRHGALWAVLTVLLTATATSCGMMTDDRADCPTCKNPLHVTLKYDYHMHRNADLFNADVEDATCYLLNMNNRVVDVQRARNTLTDKPLRDRSFGFNFEGLDEGYYRLLSVASSTATPFGSPNISIPQLNIGDDITTLNIALPHSDTPDADGRHAVPAILLDTLWMGATVTPVHVEAKRPSYDTISLVRDTKHLSITLLQTQNPADNTHDKYEVSIADDAIDYDCQNQPTQALPVLYSPYAAWTTETLDDSNVVTERTPHYDLSFGRLIARTPTTQNPRLRIVNKQDRKVILDIDLVYYLNMARNSYEAQYELQEFLDREYDYRLNVILAGSQWTTMSFSIGILSWVLRIQNSDL